MAILPAPDEVVIVHFQLDLGAPELERVAGYLSQEERVRAGRLLDSTIRTRFIAGRGRLREIIGGCMGMPPQNLPISTGEFGKPYLAGAVRLSFNLSHSGNAAVLALAMDRKVGVDVEQVRHDLQYAEMARRFFSPKEQAELFALPESQQLAAFFRCWTRKEAYLKACGAGFSQPSDSFEVSLRPGEPPALKTHRHHPDEALRWKLADLMVAGECCAALAVEHEMPPIRYGNDQAPG